MYKQAEISYLTPPIKKNIIIAREKNKLDKFGRKIHFHYLKP